MESRQRFLSPAGMDVERRLNSITMRSEVYNIDCMEYMKTLQDKCMGLTIADPPFAVKYARGKNGFGVTTKNLPTLQDLKWDSKIPDKEFFGDTWRDILKDEYKTVIREQAKASLNHLVNEELAKCSKEINESIRSWKAEVLKKLKEYDIEKDIREVAEEIIRKKFKE